MGGQLSSDALCYGCFHGLGRKRSSSQKALEKLKEASKEVRKNSKPSTPLVAAELPAQRRRCWFCCRRRRPSKGAGGAGSAASCGTYSCDDGISCPTLDELDAAQRDTLAELRRRLAKLHWPKRHDLWLKRFLAHKKWNLEKAFTAFVEMEEWRREVGADSILRERPDGTLNSVLPVDMMGFYPYSVDKKGRLVIWMSTGHVPWWRSLFERTDEALEAQLWAGEWIYAQQSHLAKVTGVWRERAVVLVDLSQLDFNYFQGLSSSSRARKRGSKQTTAQYYPGVVDKAYLLHAPSFATRAWSVMKFFLSEKLMDKAQMASSPAELEEMLAELGASNVPRSLGGTSDAPDLQLPSALMMPHEGWNHLIQAWQPREISIPAGGKHEESLVTLGGSVSWQWALVSSSITFQVQQVLTSGAVQSVVSPKECSFTDLEEPIFGRARAPVDRAKGARAPDAAPTEFRFTWDNSASHWSKKLLLRLEVGR